MENITDKLEQKLHKIELALEEVNKKLDKIMGVNQPAPKETDEEEAIGERFSAGMEKRKYRALLKKSKQQK